MDLEYLNRRHADCLARAAAAASAPARIAHQRLARAFADRIAAASLSERSAPMPLQPAE